MLVQWPDYLWCTSLRDVLAFRFRFVLCGTRSAKWARRQINHGPSLLQFRVLCLRLLQDRYVWIGILPELKEILVTGAGSHLVSPAEFIGTTDLQMHQGTEQEILQHTVVVDHLLELRNRFWTSSRVKERLTAYVDGIERASDLRLRVRFSQFVRQRRAKHLNGAVTLPPVEFDSSADRGQPISIEHRVHGGTFAELVCQRHRTGILPCSC